MLSFSKREGIRPRFEVVGCLVECDGKLLLLLRQPHKNEPDTYGCPAGKVDVGEGIGDAMKRELFEETGIVSDPEFASTAYVTYPSYQFVYHTFRLRLEKVPEIVIQSSEHSVHLWATPAEAIRLPLIPDMDAVLAHYYEIT